MKTREPTARPTSATPPQAIFLPAEKSRRSMDGSDKLEQKERFTILDNFVNKQSDAGEEEQIRISEFFALFTEGLLGHYPLSDDITLLVTTDELRAPRLFQAEDLKTAAKRRNA